MTGEVTGDVTPALGWFAGARPSPLGKDGGLVERALPVVLVQLLSERPVEGEDQTASPLTP